MEGSANGLASAPMTQRKSWTLTPMWLVCSWTHMVSYIDSHIRTYQQRVWADNHRKNLMHMGTHIIFIRKSINIGSLIFWSSLVGSRHSNDNKLPQKKSNSRKKQNIVATAIISIGRPNSVEQEPGVGHTHIHTHNMRTWNKYQRWKRRKKPLKTDLRESPKENLAH